MVEEYVFLESIEETCGGCPTVYEGTTVENEHFHVRLRHGYMMATINGTILFYANTPDLDGVCNFEDVKRYALKQRIIIEEV